MALHLSVPYASKNEVKSLGGFWLPERKTWVVPDHVSEINPFKTWIPLRQPCIVRKPYLICLSKINCWKCGAETPMIALGAKNYFTYEYANFNDPENKEQLWIKAPTPTLFSSIYSLDQQVVDYVRINYPFFKRRYSHLAQNTCYKNTCTSCNMLQGDFYHQQEPGGAFFPAPFGPVSNTTSFIEMELDHDYYIDASHGGTAYEDLFFPENRAELSKQGIRVHILS